MYTSMQLVMWWSTILGNLDVLQQEDILSSCAEVFQLPARTLSSVAFGLEGSPGYQLETGEVEFERLRTSRSYRHRLTLTLALFLQWVAQTYDNTVNWDCPVSANQLLCEFINWQFATHDVISKSRHAILAVQPVWRPLRGKLGRSWEYLKSW